MKYYIQAEPYAERCYTLDYFKDLIKEGGYTSIKLELEKRDTGGGTIYCKSEGDCFESSYGICGKFNCKEYSPRNGKNGRCRYAEVAFTGTGRFFILDKNGLKEVNT